MQSFGSRADKFQNVTVLYLMSFFVVVGRWSVARHIYTERRIYL